MPETLLLERGAEEYERPFPPDRFLQPLCRAGAEGGHPLHPVREEVLHGGVHRNQFRGQHRPARLPEPAHPSAQGLHITLAQRGQCSMGWFYGFKLHLICNEKGDLLNFMLTPGNVDDRVPLRDKSFLEQIFGKLVGDKGYICKDLFSKLFVDGIQLITKLKSNMKGQIMTIGDRILLRKRALIETINDELKNMAQIEHSRHRSVVGFTVNLMAGLAAYSFFPKKPMIDVDRVSPYENGLIQLSLF